MADRDFGGTAMFKPVVNALFAMLIGLGALPSEASAEGMCWDGSIGPNECTVWWTVQAPTADAFQMTPEQAKRLPGARTTK